MEVVYQVGLQMIQGLQSLFRGREELLFTWSKIGDPGNAFLLYFPAMFCLNQAWGIKLMWTAACAEWLNLCLKWVLYGERPYWYAVEAKIRDPNLTTVLDQFPLTCETGPGSPSGHAMVTTPVWFLLFSAFLASLSSVVIERDRGEKFHRLVSKIVWTVFAVMVALVNVSRLHMGAHFPHQVVAGTACGLAIAYAFTKLSTNDIQFRFYSLWSAILLVGGYGMYLALLGLDFDPDWSVKKAQAYCINPQWVHLNTVPFHTLARLCGALLGLGLGLKVRRMLKTEQIIMTLDSKVVSALLAIWLCKAAERIQLPSNPLELFYLLAFMKNILLPFIVVVLIPSLSVCVSCQLFRRETEPESPRKKQM